FVFHTDAKRLADIGRDANCPVRLADAKDRRRLSIDHDIAALELKDCPRRRIAIRSAGRGVLRPRARTNPGRGGKSSRYEGTASGHGEPSRGNCSALGSTSVSRWRRGLPCPITTFVNKLDHPAWTCNNRTN